MEEVSGEDAEGEGNLESREQTEQQIQHPRVVHGGDVHGDAHHATGHAGRLHALDGHKGEEDGPEARAAQEHHLGGTHHRAHKADHRKGHVNEDAKEEDQVQEVGRAVGGLHATAHLRIEHAREQQHQQRIAHPRRYEQAIYLKLINSEVGDIAQVHVQVDKEGHEEYTEQQHQRRPRHVWRSISPLLSQLIVIVRKVRSSCCE